MRRSYLCLFALIVLVASLAFGQGGNGTITGTVTDPAGAVVSGAAVEARNAETGVAYPAVSTNAGVYDIPNLPVGTYMVTVKVQGFKTYTHTNLAVAATQVLREDVALQVGSATEEVTVTAEASLLKTETGELSHNVTVSQLDDLPLLGIGTANSGTSGVKNPYNMLQILPGVSNYASSGQFTLNGLGGNMTETMRIEGQDATSRLFGVYDYTQMAQPSADSIQEVAFQTSNYAAEFGQAGSAVINMTMKSGTNQFHGSGSEYFVNEDLNAGNPFSSTASGQPGKFRPRNRRNDFGGTLGGPVYIPKIYNGRNKTFFFFNYEEYLETNLYAFTDTVPTTAFSQGNFSAISPNGNCSLCSTYGIPTTPLGGTQVDALGRPMFANEIYDPQSRATLPNGLAYANPFPNNQIPLSRIDPVSAKFAALFPAPQNSNLVGNYAGLIPGNRYTAIPSIKMDHLFTPNDKISFYYSKINTESLVSAPLGNADGLPLEIGAYRGTFIYTRTSRLNYDRTITPTLLFHAGMGYYLTQFDDHAPNLNFDPSQFGLSGFLIHRQFPLINGMCIAIPPGPTGSVPGCSGYGGMQNVGTSNQTQSWNHEEKPSFNSNLTWVHGSHTIKGGMELYLNQVYNGAYAGVTMTTGVNPTSQPFVPTNSFNGFTTGFGYASFLLGDYQSITQTAQLNYRNGQQVWGLFLQDSWKVNRKLTVDYGVRWDYSTPMEEQYGRLGQLSLTTPNADAGGHPGATIYANTCNCSFYQKTYPYGIGPRIGVAYQLDPKTVFRGGFGINYQFIAATGGGIVSTNGSYPLVGVNPYVNIETPGAIVQPAWPVTDPNRYPVLGTVGGTPGNYAPDPNEMRPPRVAQYSVGVQRQITPNTIIEASYVGNKGAWEQGAAYPNPGPLGYLSQISPSTYSQFGLFPYPGTGPCSSGTGVCASSSYNNDADRALLTQPLSSSAVQAKLASAGIKNFLPYSGFSTGNTLQAALYPLPQFGYLLPTGSPTGNSKYDSLQVKLTKRLSHNLQVNGAYTFAKGYDRPLRQDFFNPQSAVWQLQQIPPQTLTFNATYTIPKAQFLPKVANVVTHDWQLGFYANYQSGQFLAPPTSPTANFLPSEDIRVPGQPLYLKNINNIHSYNPYYDQVLNPAAWQACPTNSVCPAAYNTYASTTAAPTVTATTYYSDFRGPRTPRENGNIGRNFRIKERMNLYIRGEFVNVFNRTILPNPGTANPQNPLVKNGAGVYTSGFGVINAYNAPGTAPAVTAGAVTLLGRTGTMIARFTF